MTVYNKYSWYSEKYNTLYILSKLILPNTKGMDFKSHCKAYEEAFKMPYEKRIEKFCPKDIKPALMKEIKDCKKQHKDCKLSEYTNA